MLTIAPFLPLFSIIYNFQTPTSCRGRSGLAASQHSFVSSAVVAAAIYHQGRRTAVAAIFQATQQAAGHCPADGSPRRQPIRPPRRQRRRFTGRRHQAAAGSFAADSQQLPPSNKSTATQGQARPGRQSSPPRQATGRLSTGAVVRPDPPRLTPSPAQPARPRPA